MQKIYRDTKRIVVLWDMGSNGTTLEFEESALIDAGFFNGLKGYDKDSQPKNLNILDLQNVFRCNVTIREEMTQSVRYSEKE